jgi:uncharacterized membrane protein (UPF0127 family)
VIVETSRGVRLRCDVPRTRRERTCGLRDVDALALDEAMWFERASSVHTLGMRFEILVVRVDRGGRVVDARRVRPGRLVLPRPRIAAVLECHAEADVRVGDVIARIAAAGQATGRAPRPGTAERRSGARTTG